MDVFNSSLSRKRKKIEAKNLVSLIKSPELRRESFHLNLSSKITNEDAVLFNYVISDFNPPKSENGVLSLPGKWCVGVSKFLMNNELISFKKLSSKSVGLIYISIKLDGDEKGQALAIRYYEHRLYSRSEAVKHANESLAKSWLDICYPNSEGVNEVGDFFISNIFCFFENVYTDDYIYLKCIGNNSIINKKNWEIFEKLFAAYHKNRKKTNIERIEVYASNELCDFLGGFDVLPIEDWGGDFHLYYEDVKITKRLAVVPLPKKSDNISIRAESIQPRLLPLSINLLTNILNAERSTIVNLAEQNFGRFQLLANIELPPNLFSSNSPSIGYSASSDIKFRELPIDSRIERISIGLTDAYNEKLLSLNVGHSFITLEFVPT